MPLQDLGLNKPTAPTPNADLGDAINYAKQDPNGLVATVRWLVGFFVALFKPSTPKP